MFSLISVFGTRMCGQTLLFIVIANCAIDTLFWARFVTVCLISASNVYTCAYTIVSLSLCVFVCVWCVVCGVWCVCVAVECTVVYIREAGVLGADRLM